MCQILGSHPSISDMLQAKVSLYRAIGLASDTHLGQAPRPKLSLYCNCSGVRLF